ncbi:hypothetical protein ACFLU4_02050 [Chloroflexota bacterium]
MPKHIKHEKRSAQSRRITYPIPDSTSRMKDRPLFSFHYLQNSYCISKCQKNDKAAFTDAMRVLSSLTWSQIHGSHRHGLGTEKIKRNNIKVGIPGEIPEDTNYFWAIRFSGNKPMIGFRDNDIYHIVWFDRKLSVYNHGS